MCLCVCLSVCISAFLHVSLCVSVCLSVCLSVFYCDAMFCVFGSDSLDLFGKLLYYLHFADVAFMFLLDVVLELIIL